MPLDFSDLIPNKEPPADETGGTSLLQQSWDAPPIDPAIDQNRPPLDLTSPVPLITPSSPGVPMKVTPRGRPPGERAPIDFSDLIPREGKKPADNPEMDALMGKGAQEHGEFGASRDSKEAPDFTDRYNTVLDPAKEAEFQAWAKKQRETTGRDPLRDLFDYDMRGAWASGAPTAANGHLPDTFKKPNHPTFSNESQYNNVDGLSGGAWSKGPNGAFNYTPSPTNLQMHGQTGLTDYFNNAEPESKLLPEQLPTGYVGDNRPYQGGWKWGLSNQDQPMDFVPNGEIHVPGQTRPGAALNALSAGVVTSTGQLLAAPFTAVANQTTYHDPFEWRDLPPEDRARAQAKMDAATQKAAAQAQPVADLITSGAQDVTQRFSSVDPKWANDWAVRLSGGVGGMAPMVLGAALGGVPGGAAVAAAQGYQTTVDDALRKGASREDANNAGMMNAVVTGGLMTIPAAQWLGRLTPSLQQPVLNAAVGLGVHSGSMVGIMQAQTLADNIIARNSYDPTRALSTGLGENVTDQAILGAFLPFATHSAPHLASRLFEPRSPIASAELQAGVLNTSEAAQNPFDILSDRPNAKIPAAMKAPLADAIAAQLRYVGLPPEVGVKLVNQIGNGAADSSYAGKLVTMAMDTPPSATPFKAWHESMHALMDPQLGLLNDQDRASLYRSANTWLDGTDPGATTTRRRQIAELYNVHPLDPVVQEEGVARIAENALVNGLTPRSPVRAVADKMANFVTSLRQGLRGQGFRTSADVFNGLLAGDRAENGAGQSMANTFNNRPPPPPAPPAAAVPPIRQPPPLSEVAEPPRPAATPPPAANEAPPAVASDAEIRQMEGEIFGGQRPAPTPEAPPLGMATTPEPQSDVEAQIRAMTDPANPKDSVFLAPGTPLPDKFHAPGILTEQRPEGTLLTTDQRKAAEFKAAPTVDDGLMARLLGYPETKTEAMANGPEVVVQGKDHDGNVIVSTLASESGLPAAEAAAREQAPVVEVTTPAAAQAERGGKVAAEAEAAGTAAPIVEHVTKRGKTLRGTIQTGLTEAEAKGIDRLAFRKSGGWFIREDAAKKAAEANVEAPVEPAANTEPRPLDADAIKAVADGMHDTIVQRLRENEALQVVLAGGGPHQTGSLATTRQAYGKAVGELIREYSHNGTLDKDLGAAFNDLQQRHIGPDVVREIQRAPRPVISEHPGLVIKSLETGKVEHIQPPGTVPPRESPPEAGKPPETPKKEFENNTFFPADAAIAARERLRAKLNRLNAGFDPEMMADGFMLAGAHIENGLRKFADFAGQMISDLGDGIRPLLGHFYNSVRDYPGFDSHGMDGRDVVEKELPQLQREPISEQEGTGDGLQNPLPAGDERAGSEDVQRTGPLGEAGIAPSNDVGPGAQDAGRPAGERAEDQERPPGEHGGVAPGRGSGEGNADRLPGAGEGPEPGAARRPARPDATVKGTDFRIAPGEVDEKRGPITKARDNVAAIELAKSLIEEGRPATREEQAVLAKYVGWGGLSGAFRNSLGKFGKGLETIGERLENLLVPEEHQTASRSTQYAHYTAEHVIRSMWDAVRAMGFKGGSVLEPGMGVGHFLGMMPGDLAGSTRYHGIEMDHLTAAIAKLLYPESGIRQADFINTPIPPNTFDLAIGNPPFSNTVISADPKYSSKGFMLHDYFFAKSIDSVRPGGLLAYVTSAGTMNKMDTKARQYLAERAEFVGGARLPSDAFKRNAGTEVTTDVLFFKKRMDPISAEAAEKEPWTETVVRDLPNAAGGSQQGNVNRYFSEHPEQVLGQEGFFDKLYKDRYAVHPETGRDLPVELTAALGRLPKDVMERPPTPREVAALDFASGQKKNGSFYVDPKRGLMQYSEGAGRVVPRRGGAGGGFTAPEVERITKLVPIRDALRDVLRHDLADNTEEATAARVQLNKAYDDFVSKFGPINKVDRTTRRPSAPQQERARLEAREDARAEGVSFDDGTFNPQHLIDARASVSVIAKARQAARDAAERSGRKFDEGTFDPEDMPDIVIEKRPNIDMFRSDPESYRLRSIEHYNDMTGLADKKLVFERSVITRPIEPELKSAQDGVLWSLNHMGRLDLDAIADKMGRDRDELIADLGDHLFRVPGSRDDYQTREEYLSGDVTSKLETARAELANDPTLEANVRALEAALPPPLPPDDINMTIGMPWIPRKYMDQFAREQLKIGKVDVIHVPQAGAWKVVNNFGGDRTGIPTWSATERGAHDLLSDALNRTPPRIYKTEGYGEDKRQVFDPVATQEAQDKVNAIRDEFKSWIENDPQRNDELAALYNASMNREVLRVHNGDYLTTPGVTDGWSWRPHQTRVIARIIQTGNTYMAHAVGAGKTSAMIGAGMEMRRLGLVRKPMYVVPNHMLAQFTKEFYEQYPTAKIAVADEEKFHTDVRKQFMADVAQDDLDAVIITHSSFKKIPISDEFQGHMIREELDNITEALSGLDKQEDRITIKKLENMQERLTQKLSKAGASNQDQTNTFEEMGADFLFVDEAHEFRKLSFATRQSNLKGITPDGSDMAWDLYSKVRYLNDKNPGRAAVFASGTPVTNTMGELYSISRFLQPEALAKRGISHFDSWAQTFGDVKSELEPLPDGSYKPVTRFSRFVNMPELYKMVGSTMDVVTSAQLAKYVTRPEVAGGARKLHLAPFTDKLMDYQKILGDRMTAIANRTGRVQKGDDIILSVINDGRHSALDPRFVMDTPNDPKSKLNEGIANVIQIWKDTKDTQFYEPRDGYSTPSFRGPATQMVFMNIGVNGRGPIGFSGYDWMRTAFKRAGIPDKEVAFIGDYKTTLAKQTLFNDVNDGKVRILVGSTKKMGTGVNAQRRLIAIHNFDPLWYPADDEQRIGRGLRQGNMNPELQIHDYTTTDTYDRNMWSMMGRKGRFIEQFFRGDPEMRDMEDLGEASAYEQASAMATSDPRIFELTDMQQELDRALRRQSAHTRSQYALKSQLGTERWYQKHYEEIASSIDKDVAQRQDTTGDSFKMTIGGDTFTKRADAAAALVEKAPEVWEGLGKGQRAPLGNIGGFRLGIERDKANGYDVFLQWNDGRLKYLESPVGLDAEHAKSMIARAEIAIRSLDEKAADLRNQRDAAAVRANDIEPLLGKEFAGGPEIARMEQRIEQLKREMQRPYAPPAVPWRTVTAIDEAGNMVAQPLFSLREPNRAPLYSAVSRAADTLRQERGTGDQMAAMLARVPGVKPEEMRWMGLTDWLKGQKSVTKAQIQDYVRANSLDVREVVGNGSGTHYSQYSTPGPRTGYHELLLTLPKSNKVWALQDEYHRLWKEFGIADPRTQAAHAKALTYRKDDDFQSGHWQEQNVLAHVRFNERTAPDGARTLMVEEAQSDWHQTGRRRGYQDIPQPEGTGNFVEWGEKQGFSRADLDAAWDERDTNPLAQRFFRENDAAGMARTAWGKRVPDAPFKTSWPALVMKRVIQWAVDHDFDRVAWTNGETQAKRYGVATEEGMKGFYDKILPAEVNKLIGKYGGKVGQFEITDPAVDNPTGWTSSETHKPETAIGVHGFDIPAQLHTAVKTEGLPLFSLRQRVETAFKGVSVPDVRRQMGLGMSSRDEMGLVRKSIDEVQFAFSPTSRGPDAKEMEHVVRRRASMLARGSNQAIHDLENYARAIDRLPEDQQLAITHRVEAGIPQPTPELQTAMTELKKVQDTRLRMLQSIGKLKDVLNSDEYMGRIYSNYKEWKAGEEAKGQTEAERIATARGVSKSPLRGSGNFMKQRTFATLEEAMDAGLIPVTTNPIKMQILKIREMDKFYHATRMADEIKESGLAQWVPAGKEGEVRSNGWVKLDDQMFQPRIRGSKVGAFGIVEPGNYWAPEPAARVFNNYVSRGLAGNSVIYDALRTSNNFLNSAQLGLSGFHATFVTLDAAISTMAHGMQQVARGISGRDLGEKSRSTSIGQGLGNMAMGAAIPISAAKTMMQGSALKRAWLDPQGATPEMQKLADLLNSGGGRISMDQFYRSNASGAFFKSWRDLMNPGGAFKEALQMAKDTPLMAPFKIAGRMMETLNEPLMGQIVPRMKLGVFSQMAQDFMERHPDASPTEVSDAMTKAWDSVENRMGQMTYDNVFWNKMLKDSAFLMNRSVGWNLGTIRELAGAGVDTAAALKNMATGKNGSRVPELTNRMAYAMAMPLLTAMIGGTLTYLLTGNAPTSMLDYFYPRSGTGPATDPDRLSIPGYIKDVIAWHSDPLRTAVNKISPLPNALAEMLYYNQDYYGGIIYAKDVDNPWIVYPQYMLNQALPFSIRAKMKNDQLGASMATKMLNFWGIQPAPQSITHPERAEAWRIHQEALQLRKRNKEQGLVRLAP